MSKDGNTWYELAGSEYYTASAKHDYKVTYVNGDTSFKAAADVAWQDNDGVKGVLSVNESEAEVVKLIIRIPISTANITKAQALIRLTMQPALLSRGR